MSRGKEGDTRRAAGLLDEIRAENATKGGTCTLHEFLPRLNAEERAAVMAALTDPTIQATALARWLTKHGYEGTYQVIARHRQHGCRMCGVAK